MVAFILRNVTEFTAIKYPPYPVFLYVLVPPVGFEPTRLATLAFKAIPSTSFGMEACAAISSRPLTNSQYVKDHSLYHLRDSNSYVLRPKLLRPRCLPFPARWHMRAYCRYTNRSLDRHGTRTHISLSEPTVRLELTNANLQG